MKTFQTILKELNACNQAVQWADTKTIEEVVEQSYRGDWLLWLGKKLDLPLNKMTLAKARCAKTVIHLMKDQRSINAVNIAERFGLDECTLEELNMAKEEAYQAKRYADAAAAAADAAAYAAAAAADAAAADAADAAAYADYAAAYADYAAAYAAAYAYAEKTKNQQQTADICKEILGQLITDKINELINY